MKIKLDNSYEFKNKFLIRLKTIEKIAEEEILKETAKKLKSKGNSPKKKKNIDIRSSLYPNK